MEDKIITTTSGPVRLDDIPVVREESDIYFLTKIIYTGIVIILLVVLFMNFTEYMVKEELHVENRNYIKDNIKRLKKVEGVSLTDKEHIVNSIIISLNGKIPNIKILHRNNKPIKHTKYFIRGNQNNRDKIKIKLHHNEHIDNINLYSDERLDVSFVDKNNIIIYNVF